MLPKGADAVVMLENARLAHALEIEIYKAVSSEENTIRQGEDLKTGDLILKEGRQIRPVEVGGLLSQGITKVKVYRQPLVGIISSGDELVPPGESIKPGQIRDINSCILAGLVEQHFANHRFYGIAPDDKNRLRTLIQQAHNECDAVVVTAGSSVSSRDITAELIQELGKPGILVHGINIKPGKPTILAVCGGKPVIGLPGNPISAFVIAGLVVVPMIEKLSGNRSPGFQPCIPAVLTANVPSQSGRLDFIPVSLTPAGGKLMATPIFYKSNLIFNLVKADGLMRIPEDATGLEAGDQVEIHPFS
jgi:molybdopterin molybdotransferase